MGRGHPGPCTAGALACSGGWRLRGAAGDMGGVWGSTGCPVPPLCACGLCKLCDVRSGGGMGAAGGPVASVPGHGGGGPDGSSVPAGASSLCRSPSLLLLEEPGEEGVPSAGPHPPLGTRCLCPLSSRSPAGSGRALPTSSHPPSPGSPGARQRGPGTAGAGAALPPGPSGLAEELKGIKGRGRKKKSSQKLKQNLKPKSATKPGSPALGRSSCGIAVGPGGAHGSPPRSQERHLSTPGSGGKLRQRQQRCTQINI